MWQDMKAAWEWIIVPLLLGMIWVRWGTLISWAKQEAKRSSKEVL
jgi:hypothetical protein